MGGKRENCWLSSLLICRKNDGEFEGRKYRTNVQFALTVKFF